MLKKRCPTAVILTTLALLGTSSVSSISIAKPLLSQSQCTNSNIENYIQQLKNGENAAFDALVGCNSKVVPALTKALENKDSDVRSNAAVALAQIGTDAKDAVPALITALQDKDSNVRNNASEALGQIGKDAIPALITALPTLITALRDKDSNVRNNAAEALGQIGKDDVPALITALQDEDGDYQLLAAVALANIGVKSQDVVSVLLANLEGNPYCDSNTILASETLGKMGKDIVPTLITTLKNKDYGVRFGAIRALKNIGVEAKDAVRYAAIQALKQIDSEQSRSVLEKNKQIINAISKKQYMFVSSVCPNSATITVKKTISTNIKNKPLLICKIPQIKAMLRWKCP